MQRFIFKTEKEKILKELEYYGIKKLPYLMIISGKEKVRGYTGDFSNEEIVKFDQDIGIDILGLYLFNYSGGELRLSFDSITILKDQIKKNILELDEKQAKEWINGQDIFLTKEDQEKLKNEPKGFKIIKIQDDLYGTGKLLADRLVNYLPKERRIKARQ